MFLKMKTNKQTKTHKIGILFLIPFLIHPRTQHPFYCKGQRSLQQLFRLFLMYINVIPIFTGLTSYSTIFPEINTSSFSNHPSIPPPQTMKIISLIGDKREALPFKAERTANFEDGS